MAVSHGRRKINYSGFTPLYDAADIERYGQLKQNLYNEGVNRVQSKIEELGGLDIFRNVDRQYFKQELDKVMRKVEENANLDFSNPDVVRGIMNISRPLENDPIIRNALVSTQELRRRQSQLANIRNKKPEFYSPQNEWFFMKDAYEWVNSDDISQSLSPREYTPYKDLSKKLGDILPKLKADVTSKISQDPNIKGILNVTEIEELTKSRIAEALNGILDQSDMQQLNIDAAFSLENIPDLRGVYQEDTLGNIKMLKQLNKVAKAQIKALENANLQGTKEYMDLKEQEQALVYRVSELEDQYENHRDMSDDELKSIYFNDYFERYKKGVGDMYAYSSAKTKVQNDPAYLENLRQSYLTQRSREINATRLEVAKINADSRVEAAKVRGVYSNSDIPLVDRNGRAISKTTKKAYENIRLSLGEEIVSDQPVTLDKLLPNDDVARSQDEAVIKKIVKDLTGLDADLSDIEVKRAEDGTLHYRVSEGGTIKHIYQPDVDKKLQEHFGIRETNGNFVNARTTNNTVESGIDGTVDNASTYYSVPELRLLPEVPQQLKEKLDELNIDMDVASDEVLEQLFEQQPELFER